MDRCPQQWFLSPPQCQLDGQSTLKSHLSFKGLTMQLFNGLGESMEMENFQEFHEYAAWPDAYVNLKMLLFNRTPDMIFFFFFLNNDVLTWRQTKGEMGVFAWIKIHIKC